MLASEPELPILVIVENGRWDALSFRPIPSIRDLSLVDVLKEMGGVSDTVEDGLYHFNVRVLEDDKYAVSLTPLAPV